jgi:hypothetical protein
MTDEPPRQPPTQHLSFPRRVAPALLLVPLAPIVAEFLLGDFTIRKIVLAIVLAPMYGCGALLIREVTRRTGRGWPTILLFASAYSLVEEGFLTQSLFNPNYVGQRLLDYGYLPALGTSLNWSLFVLSIHVVWSIATPILIAEGFAAGRRTEPWLKVPGLMITALLFGVGCVSTATFSLHASPFLASRAQFVTTGVLVVIAIGAAFAIKPQPLSRVSTTDASRAPQSWWALLFALAAAIAFLLVEGQTRGRGMLPVIGVLAPLALEILAIVVIVRWSRRPGWGPLHYLAIATGTTLTYALFGFNAFLQGHTNLGEPTTTVDLVGQVVETLAVLLLIAWSVRRNPTP